MLHQLILTLALICPQKDSALHSQYFWSCVRQGISGNNYFLRPDSVAIMIPQGENRTYSPRIAGKWSYSNGMIKWNRNSSAKLYRVEMIGTLSYLISDEMDLNEIKNKIITCLKNEPLLTEYKIIGKDAKEILLLRKRLEFITVTSCFCDMDFLIELPQEFASKYRFDLPRR